MKNSLPVLSLATLLVFGSGNTSAPAATLPPAAGPTSAAALVQQWTEAMQQHDMAKATACLSKNVRFLANGSPVVSGRDSVSTYWLKGSFSSTSNLKPTPLQMSSDATTAYGTGYYTYDVKPMANLPKGATGRGSYMILSRKEGAIWQFTYIHLAEDPIKVNK
jgi:ketosteroid isomerase-like protein